MVYAPDFRNNTNLIIHTLGICVRFNKDKWGRPGPYVAKSITSGTHFDDSKWKAPKCLIDLLVDKQVLCVGHTIKSDFTRFLRTFFPEGWTQFNPRFVDVKTLWKAAAHESFRATKTKTLASMMKLFFKLILPKPQKIRTGQWRSHECAYTVLKNFPSLGRARGSHVNSTARASY